MNKCPVCQSSRIVKRWEYRNHRGNNGCSGKIFTGKYYCPNCDTTIHASGINRDGEPTFVTWNPNCPDHGTEPVYQTDLAGREFACGICYRRFEHVDGKIKETWQPGHFQRQPATEPQTMRMGGLPHD